MHGSKRSALVYLFGGLVLVMMLIMAAVSAAGLPLQPLTVSRATFAPGAFSVCVDGCCVVFQSALACSRGTRCTPRSALFWAPQPEPSAYVLFDRRAVDELCDDLDLPTSAPGLAAAIAKRVMAVCALRAAAADVSVDAALQRATGDAEGAGA